MHPRIDTADDHIAASRLLIPLHRKCRRAGRTAFIRHLGRHREAVGTRPERHGNASLRARTAGHDGRMRIEILRHIHPIEHHPRNPRHRTGRVADRCHHRHLGCITDCSRRRHRHTCRLHTKRSTQQHGAQPSHPRPTFHDFSLSLRFSTAPQSHNKLPPAFVIAPQEGCPHCAILHGSKGMKKNRSPPPAKRRNIPLA